MARTRGADPSAAWPLLLANAAVMIAVAGVAVALRPTPTCTAEPRERWVPEAVFLERVLRERRIAGVRAFEVTSTNCYKIRASRDGTPVEIYFDPVTGAVVQGGSWTRPCTTEN